MDINKNRMKWTFCVLLSQRCVQFCTFVNFNASGSFHSTAWDPGSSRLVHSLNALFDPNPNPNPFWPAALLHQNVWRDRGRRRGRASWRSQLVGVLMPHTSWNGGQFVKPYKSVDGVFTSWFTPIIPPPAFHWPMSSSVWAFVSNQNRRNDGSSVLFRPFSSDLQWIKGRSKALELSSNLEMKQRGLSAVCFQLIFWSLWEKHFVKWHLDSNLLSCNVSLISLNVCSLFLFMSFDFMLRDDAAGWEVMSRFLEK